VSRTLARATAVADRRVTGLSREVLADLVAELGPRWQACQEARGWPIGRAGGRSGPGAWHRLVFLDRLLATLVHLRHGATHDVLACRFGVSRSTITRAVGEVRPLLGRARLHRGGGVRLRTLADVVAHLGASRQLGPLDATAVWVCRPAAGRAGRHRFVSGQARADTAQGAGDHRCRRAAAVLRADPPGSIHDLTQARPAA
jgi:hypothetical protein